MALWLSLPVHFENLQHAITVISKENPRCSILCPNTVSHTLFAGFFFFFLDIISKMMSLIPIKLSFIPI